MTTMKATVPEVMTTETMTMMSARLHVLQAGPATRLLVLQTRRLPHRSHRERPTHEHSLLPSQPMLQRPLLRRLPLQTPAHEDVGH